MQSAARGPRITETFKVAVARRGGANGRFELADVLQEDADTRAADGGQ